RHLDRRSFPTRRSSDLRHPKVRIAFLESGGGWIAPWLDRMDRHFDDKGFNDSGLSMRPSELFQRNCWISFEPVERSLSVLADFIDRKSTRLNSSHVSIS